MINGEMTHKGSAAHEAAITGDTVGDPFKDTSGPSMNILIKLTCLIGLVIAPILGEGTATHTEQESTVEMTIETIEKKVAIEDNEVEIANENNNVIATEEESSAVTIEDKK
jgi:K(+)-stimulated pyrophosphate-energized sodium pump